LTFTLVAPYSRDAPRSYPPPALVRVIPTAARPAAHRRDDAVTLSR
jgi:hypothetical protein